MVTSTLASEAVLEPALTMTFWGTLTGRLALLAGLVIDTVGAVTGATVTETGVVELTVLPELSVPIAVNTYVPEAEGVNVTLNGADVADPMLTPLAKNWIPVNRPLPRAA